MHSAAHPVLIPLPRSLSVGGPGFSIDERTGIVPAAGDIAAVAGRIRAGLQEACGILCPIRSDENGPRIRLGIDSALPLPGQGYRLHVSDAGADLIGRDADGLRYAVETLLQLVRQFGRQLPGCVIEDAPAFLVRGVMIDISRDKVPTMETLLHLVDFIASLKFNHLELYTEHTFAYRNHREVWRDADPMTADEIRALDAYCAERGVDLVPNQNSFGHFARWLAHSSYRHLSECTGPFTYPWGSTGQGPLSLDPENPGSLALLDELYDELLPNFRSGKFNVGCDEVFDLGQGHSRDRCKTDGRGRVYLEFVRKIYQAVSRRGRTMHMWGDMLLKDPDVLSDLPDDVVVLDWGYEADHPFDEECARLSDAGMPFYVCPGTSSWLTVLGRTENCLANLDAAARAGRAHGASGLLVTDWGDQGHWQPLPVSYLGFTAGAAAAWCGAAPAEEDLVRSLDLHVFQDAARVMGRTACDAGNVYLAFRNRLHNRSMLYHLLVSSPEEVLRSGVSPAEVEAAREQLHAVLRNVAGARMLMPDAALVQAEFEFGARLLLHAADRTEAVLDSSWTQAETQARLDGGLDERIEEIKHVWRRRNREGGMNDSIRKFESARIGPDRAVRSPNRVECG